MFVFNHRLSFIEVELSKTSFMLFFPRQLPPMVYKKNTPLNVKTIRVYLKKEKACKREETDQESARKGRRGTINTKGGALHGESERKWRREAAQRMGNVTKVMRVMMRGEGKVITGRGGKGRERGR